MVSSKSNRKFPKIKKKKRHFWLCCFSFFSSDERIRYLEIAYAAPEELLIDYGVTVGILGIGRDELDPVLMPKERTSEDINKEVRELPKFKIPPRVHHM